MKKQIAIAFVAAVAHGLTAAYLARALKNLKEAI